MTITETAPDTDPGPAPVSLLEALATGTDHMFLGRVWAAAGGLFLLLCLVVGILVGIERINLDGADLFGSGDEVFQFWSFYRVGLVLLALVPLLIGLATAVIPLQVGASSIVFPRAAALALWTWLIGAAVTAVGFLADGGLGTPNAGSQREAIALTMVGLLLVITGVLLATVCILTTLVVARVSGMTLRRIPYFSWSMLVAGTLWLVTLPVLAANAVLAYVDLRGRTAVHFGAEDAIWDQFSWAFTHPQVYALSVPLIGIAFDIVPVTAGLRQRNHDVVLAMIGLFGAIGFGAYAQSFFDTPGTPVMEEALYVAGAFLAVPLVLVLLGGLADSLRRGAMNLKGRPPAPLVLSLLSMLLLLVGTVVGAARSIAPFELLERSTTGAQMTFTIGAALVGAIAGMLWWGDRVTGRKAPQGLGLLAGLVVSAGVLVIGLSDTITGFLGLNDFFGVDEVAAGSPDGGVEAVNAVAAFGSLLLLAGVLVWALVGWRRLQGPEAPADPWGGHTLEWATSPVSVTSERPLLDAAAVPDEGAS
ncbi:MAG: cbb3-type cytochrome c oxidase subunit I [Actinomycetota bacterium]|nr:cbb3-type cytochrome c oxidase subunit I [Actinomycetota bacterium]